MTNVVDVESVSDYLNLYNVAPRREDSLSIMPVAWINSFSEIARRKFRLSIEVPRMLSYNV